MNKILLIFTASFPALAFAHEEHGHSFVENIWHVLSSPEHAWPLTIAVVVAVIVGVVKQRS